MPAFIVVEGLKPYDGRYELDWNFNTRQYGWVKRMSGNDMDDMFTKIEDGKADAELVMVWALIALDQAGRVEYRDVPALWERMIDEPFGSIVRLEIVEDQEQEGEESSPPEPSLSLSVDTSGPSSSRSSETLRKNQQDSGTPVSATSELDRAGLEN